MRSVIVWVYVCGIMLSFLPVSFAEELQVTSYYPAPYGSYRELTTTSNTYLAADSGSVGIGTRTPQAKLDVNGNVVVNGTIIAAAGLQGALMGWCRCSHGLLGYNECESLSPASCTTPGLTPIVPCQCPPGYRQKLIGGHWFEPPSLTELFYSCYKE